VAAGLSFRDWVLSFCEASFPWEAAVVEAWQCRCQQLECGWCRRRHSWVRAAMWLMSIAMQDHRNLGILPHGLSNSAHLQRAEIDCLAAWSRMAGALTVRWAGWKARPKNCGPLLLPGPPPSSTPAPPGSGTFSSCTCRKLLCSRLETRRLSKAVE
jgi:hypothetical protein